MIIINKSEIILAVKNYIKDEKAKYAILINGPWGCGKTFLYEKYLIGEINKISNPNNKKRRKNIYISLYGISSIETLSKQVMADYLFYSKNNKGKEVVKKTAGLLGILSNVFSLSIGPVKADLSKAFSKVTNLTKIKNLVVCFDDLERCTIPINELFGFVNNLIEHCDCKVIILADEKNIGKIFVNTNVEQKYQTILTGERKVILDNKEGLKKENINENSDITIDELKEITEHLYSENYIYKDIKEKIVGKTYNYCESNEEIINDLLIGNDRYKGYVENEIYNNFLIKQIENIISGFNEVNNRNIRNIIVWIDIFKNIFLACDNNLKNNDFFNDIIEEFIRYSIWVVVSYRNNLKIISSAYYGDYDYVHLEKKEYIHIIKFSYIDNYVKTGFLKEKDLIDAAKSIEMRKERERLYENEIVQSTGLAYKELVDWRYMEDEDIKYHVNNMLEELKNNKYSYRDYSKIIDLLLFFSKNKLYSGDIIEVQQIMINLIMNDDKIQYENDIPISFSNEDDKNDFEKIYAPIAQNRKLRNSLIEKAEIDEENIYCNADNFYKHCRNRTEYYCGKRSFMSYIDINKIIELINISNLKDVYTIADSFSVIYYMGNVKDFYLRDLELLKLLKEDLSNRDMIKYEGVTREIAINFLKGEIEKYISKLSDEKSDIINVD